MSTTTVYRAGMVPYEEAWALQKSLVAARSRDERPDTLLLLQHPHTYTLGSSGKREHLLMPAAEREALGVTVLDVDRGGDITYHGPGQLVGYPILKLDTHPDTLRADVVAYVRDIERLLIHALAQFGIEGQQYPDYTGVWVQYAGQLQKVAAIGVKVNTRRVTYHGFALNVDPDMRFFEGIIPCGIDDKPVISMAQLLGTAPEMAAVEAAIIESFGVIFGSILQPRTSLT